MNPTNEQIAAWLDPQRKRAGWWKWSRNITEIGSFGDKGIMDLHIKVIDKSDHSYTGPDFYAPGVCAEEVEPVVLASGCQYWRTHEFTQVSRAVTLHFNEITRNPHHPTAINMALAKIKEANHA